jgi:hypothetical protein
VIWKLPVAVVHVGCVTAPTVGAVGVVGCGFTTIFDDAVEVQPEALVRVNVYVPVLAVTNPVAEILTTLGVNVYVFAALYPVIWKLPVAVVHVGCVTAPTVGAAGRTVLIVTEIVL